MNVEIGSEAAQFPEKEYINGIFVTVRVWVDPRDTVVNLIYARGLGIILLHQDFPSLRSGQFEGQKVLTLLEKPLEIADYLFSLLKKINFAHD
jgi:hypothetical protein